MHSLRILIGVGGGALVWFLSRRRVHKPSEHVPRSSHEKNPLKVITTTLKRIPLNLRYLVRKPRIDDVSALIERHINRCTDYRKILLPFGENLRVFPANVDHTHPRAAAFRSAVTSHLHDIVLKAGMEPYDVSCPASYTGVGSRYFYAPKDVCIPFKNDRVPDNACIVMVDVDYYADMHRWLSLGRPILMYTFAPNTMCGRRDEYSWRFVGDEVEMTVKGGACYRHRLWSYAGDTLVVNAPDEGVLTFAVEQRVVPDDTDHRVVLLSPTGYIPPPYGDFDILQASALKRHVNVGSLYDPITDVLSLSAPGSYHSVELPGRLYDAVRERLANKKGLPVVSDVERMLADAKVANPITAAPLVFNLIGPMIERNVVFTGLLTSNYHPVVKGAPTTEDGGPRGQSATSNIVLPGAAYPTESVASDLACIKGRVDAPRNAVRPPNIYKTYAHDFVTSLVKCPKTGTPWSNAQVVSVQDKAAQRARIEQVACSVSLQSTNKLKAMVKGEAYSPPNHPRNITTMSPELTLQMSAFTYAFKEAVLKKMPFYSPGKTPDEICKRLGELCVDGAILSDYSKFDGSISEFLQNFVVRNAYSRWCSDAYTKELHLWFDRVFVQTATTKHGLKYNPGYGTRSGSPITTDGNTMINAYVVYCALRKLGYSGREAFKLLGLYCGDDGVNKPLPGLKNMLIVVASELGLKLEVEELKNGPYDFCGRRFIEPSRTPDSYQNLKRTLPKLHLITNSSLSVEQRVTNKAIGYLVTDSKTPLISDWAKKVMELTGLQPKQLTNEEEFKMLQPWPQTDGEAIFEAVARDLGVDTDELFHMQTLIMETRALDDFPVLFDWETKPKLSIAREGDVITVEAPGPHNSSEPVENTEHVETDTKPHVSTSDKGQVTIESPKEGAATTSCGDVVKRQRRRARKRADQSSKGAGSTPERTNPAQSGRAGEVVPRMESPSAPSSGATPKRIGGKTPEVSGKASKRRKKGPKNGPRADKALSNSASCSHTG